MSILVTGGAGYIGSVTVERLLEGGASVVVLDDLCRGHRTALDPSVPFYEGKVGDRGLIARISREHKLDACVHFAALAYVGESMVEPERYYENNVAQGIALLSSLLQAGVGRFVFSSSCATYGDPDEIPIVESTQQRPKSPYGWSKLMLEQVLSSYDLAHGLKFVALRYFNAAGATEKLGELHEPETHLVPNVLAVASGAKSDLVVFGDDYPTPDGTAIRDYVHVADLAQAHILALDYLRNGGNSEFVNLGTGEGYSVLQVVEAARKVTGHLIPVRKETRRPGDAIALAADSSKANAVLGWKPAESDMATILKSQWEWSRRKHDSFKSK
jgi:UDP-glucose 4-epimerase